MNDSGGACSLMERMKPLCSESYHTHDVIVLVPTHLVISLDSTAVTLSYLTHLFGTEISSTGAYYLWCCWVWMGAAVTSDLLTSDHLTLVTDW